MPIEQAPTSPEVVHAAIRNRLVDQGIFADEHCFLALEPEQGDPIPGTDIYCTITPEGHLPDDRAFTGGGNTVFLFYSYWQVILWVRSYIDQAGRHDEWLRNQSHGALSTFGNTLAALSLWYPLNDAGTAYLFAEPMRMARAGFTPRKPRVRHADWGTLTSTWEVQYQIEVVTPED